MLDIFFLSFPRRRESSHFKKRRALQALDSRLRGNDDGGGVNIGT